MSRSILQNEKVCFVCGTPLNLHRHHVFGGYANRRLSERWGLWLYLCYEHHEGNTGVHLNRELELEVKRFAQAQFEATQGTREDFRRIFGKSYIV